MPDDKLFFKEELSLDLRWLDGKATLHIFDIATEINAADSSALRVLNPSVGTQLRTCGTLLSQAGLHSIWAIPTNFFTIVTANQTSHQSPELFHVTVSLELHPDKCNSINMLLLFLFTLTGPQI